MNDIATYVRDRATAVHDAAPVLACLSSEVKDRALREMAQALEDRSLAIQEQNQRDRGAARERGMNDALFDRLTLTEDRVRQMAQGLRDVAALADPVGSITDMTRRPDGFMVGRMRVPIGVIGIVYESRPNVTADAAALCIKSGNGVILKGGSEAIHSNTLIARILDEAGRGAGLPADCVALLETTERAAVDHLLTLDDLIDVIIPRGGSGLIRMVTETSRIPVIKHDKGLCHTYVDSAADLDMAQSIVLNAKVQRPGVCNALESLLVHRDVADEFLPRLNDGLKTAEVTVHGCAESVARMPGAVPAVAADWDTEWHTLDLTVKVVDGYDDATAHIRKHGSGHTEVIITGDHTRAMQFLREVDAASVQVNCSSRFHDGAMFGLGAEIGISTSRIHARGAMGLTELTCQKFVVLGDGQIRT